MNISVIIPTWNRAHYLPDALESVFAQTLPPAEVIVVDDGSTDGTAALLQQRYPGVKTLFRSHAGVAAARNAGLRVATGSHIAFLDSDDLWLPHKLETQSRALREAPSLDMVFGRYEEFSSPETSPATDSQAHAPAQSIHDGYCAGTLLACREPFDRAGLFDENLVFGEFVEWFDRARGEGFTHVLLSEVLTKRRIHRGNLTRFSEGPSSGYARALKAVLDRRRARNPSSK